MVTPTASPEATPTPSPVATPTASPDTVQKPTEPLPSGGNLFYNGNRAIPEIALTFDDGPNPPYTDQILAILQHYGVHATFFCVGRLVQAYPTLVEQEFTQGNLVENHTWGHPYLPYLSGPSIIWQLTTTTNAIQGVTGVRPIFFRPPYGAFNASVLAYANQFGLTTILWDVDPRDWSIPGVNVIVARVRAQTQNGSIILMHDGGGNRSQTVAALPAIIEWYQQHGFRFVTLQQLVNDFNQKAASSTSVTTLSSSPTSVETAPVPTQSEVWRRRTDVV
ncbi:MAG: polysaccharide deacetylase family protein [Chloroflexi bacterium]|nr:polysaccharide deacetylase family protein [Chloroflexota bacterium]